MSLLLGSWSFFIIIALLCDFLLHCLVIVGNFFTLPSIRMHCVDIFWFKVGILLHCVFAFKFSIH